MCTLLRVRTPVGTGGNRREAPRLIEVVSVCDLLVSKCVAVIAAVLVTPGFRAVTLPARVFNK